MFADLDEFGFSDGFRQIIGHRFHFPASCKRFWEQAVKIAVPFAKDILVREASRHNTLLLSRNSKGDTE